MAEKNRLVPLHSPHRHKKKGDETVNDNRPVYETKIGNSTIKIRSALPFMSVEERKQWFQDHADLPEVKNFKRVWAETLYKIEEQEVENSEAHGA